MNRIKEVRSLLQITQARLASEIGVSRSTVAMWETSGSQPDPEMLIKLSNFLGVSVDYLLGRDMPDDKKITPDEPELTEGEREWVELFRQLSDDQRQLIRGMMRGIVNEINNER